MIKIAANLSTLFRDLPWSERFEAARSEGFDGVEIQFPYAEPSASLALAARAAGLPVVLINAPVSLPTHPLGIAGCAELCGKFRDQLPVIEEYALALGARYVHILAGRAEPGAARDASIEAYVENLSRAAERLRPRGIEVLIEPLNAHDAPGYLLDSFDLAAQVIERCGAGVGLQFDVYHVSRMGLDLLPEFERRLKLIRHIQFADAPGRHEPGTGEIAFDGFLAKLLEADYQGWLGAEYFPQGATADGAASIWLRDWRERLSA
jgi:hydroxypyruvate isomerase